MAEPISLIQAKAHLRLDSSFGDDDELVADLITDAREFVESETGLVIVPRALTETAPQLGAWIELFSWPVTAVTAIRYPVAGTMTALAAGSWLMNLNRRPVRLLPAAFGWGVGALTCTPAWALPTLPVEIDVAAGYASLDDVPRRAMRAMLLLIAHWYTNRSAAEVGSRAAGVSIPFAVAEALEKLKDRVI